ncbi:MAG: hypothetical protein COB67_00510 [SAR324 cluster bacterium]|uniref:Uncharacterized protein n=1 Tax=SAR324 cluster bacterium TaxID=2024889 RepID=A0A2A4TBI0_9DELT|nr:MAG: hypothetical protein COB67_00510 [SAR324 cluster bacterium]
MPILNTKNQGRGKMITANKGSTKAMEQIMKQTFSEGGNTMVVDGKGDKSLMAAMQKTIYKVTRNHARNKARKSSKKKHAMKRK